MKTLFEPSRALPLLLSILLPACGQVAESPSEVPSADGTLIAYEVRGSGQPALVFVHGWSCDRGYWEAQVPHFSLNHRVVTVDLAGHGESGAGRDVWSMRAFGEDVAAVVAALDLDEVVLVGHSMGGPVVVEAARVLGDRVRGVVGVDTFNDVSVRYSPEELEAFFQPFRTDFSGSVRAMVRSNFFVPESDTALVDWIVADMSSADPVAAMGAMEEMNAWTANESEMAFGELRAPVRVINSDSSPTNVEAGRDYTSSFDAVLMSGVGHFVMMEDPDTFNRLLDQILSEFSGIT